MNNKELRKVVIKCKGEINGAIDGFIDKIDAATQGTNEYLTMDQLEDEWGNLEDKTKKTFLEMVSDVVSLLNEEGLIESKKESLRKGE